MKTPLELLLHESPDYTFLEVLGCVCWPHTHLCNNRKLEFWSEKCILLSIILFIKAISVFMFHLIVCLSCAMIFLMRMSSHFLHFQLPPCHHLCTHHLLCMINLKMLHTLLRCCLTMVQVLVKELVFKLWKSPMRPVAADLEPAHLSHVHGVSSPPSAPIGGPLLTALVISAPANGPPPAAVSSAPPSGPPPAWPPLQMPWLMGQGPLSIWPDSPEPHSPPEPRPAETRSPTPRMIPVTPCSPLTLVWPAVSPVVPLLDWPVSYGDVSPASSLSPSPPPPHVSAPLHPHTHSKSGILFDLVSIRMALLHGLVPVWLMLSLIILLNLGTSKLL
jgi:hypothetical protein